MIRARRRSIYCSPAEWAEITERARSAGMKNSPFVIACALAEDEEERPDTLLALTEEEQRTLYDRGLCCKLGEGAMRNQGASCSPYDSALARRSCSHAMASVRAHGQRPKARSTIRASPTMPPWRANIPAWPLRSARISSKPLIVA